MKEFQIVSPTKENDLLSLVFYENNNIRYEHNLTYNPLTVSWNITTDKFTNDCNVRLITPRNVYNSERISNPSSLIQPIFKYERLNIVFTSIDLDYGDVIGFYIIEPNTPMLLLEQSIHNSSVHHYNHYEIDSKSLNICKKQHDWVFSKLIYGHKNIVICPFIKYSYDKIICNSEQKCNINLDQNEHHQNEHHRIDLNNTKLIQEYVMSNYTREQEYLHQRIPEIIDAQTWCAINWIQQKKNLIPQYPKQMFPLRHMEEFHPKVIFHRKLFKIIDKVNSTYIFSPMLQSPNKWTPIYEICNYKLACLLRPPPTLYFPNCFEGLVHELGVGSFKEFIHIKKSDVSTNNLPKELQAWICTYDYLICNIERNWNDHLCLDENNRFVCLDNDLGIHHEFKLPVFDLIQYLPKETIRCIQNINLLTIGGPYHWVSFVQPRLQNLIGLLKLHNFF